jgi:hypothetical protein
MKAIFLIIKSNFRKQKKMILLSGLFIALAALFIQFGINHSAGCTGNLLIKYLINSMLLIS